MTEECMSVWYHIAEDVDAGWLDWDKANAMSYEEALDYLGYPFNDPDFLYDREVEMSLA